MQFCVLTTRSLETAGFLGINAHTRCCKWTHHAHPRPICGHREATVRCMRYTAIAHDVSYNYKTWCTGGWMHTSAAHGNMLQACACRLMVTMGHSASEHSQVTVQTASNCQDHMAHRTTCTPCIHCEHTRWRVQTALFPLYVAPAYGNHAQPLGPKGDCIPMQFVRFILQGAQVSLCCADFDSEHTILCNVVRSVWSKRTRRVYV